MTSSTVLRRRLFDVRERTEKRNNGMRHLHTHFQTLQRYDVIKIEQSRFEFIKDYLTALHAC